MTKREELELFLKRTDEFIDAKYIIADIKIINVLKTIAASETLIAIFKNCLTDFDYNKAKKNYLVKSKFLAEDKGEFILPPNSRELLAFIFNILMDIDTKRIDFSNFLTKYFYVDGSFSASFEAFKNAMIKPFRNSVEVIMESVIEGKVQDPLEAITEHEEWLVKEKKLEEEKLAKEKELSQKKYYNSVKSIKEILLKDKTNIKNSKLKDDVKKEIVLVIDMLANAINSEDKDAVEYAFVSYKYVCKVHFIKFIGRIRKMRKLIKDFFDAI